MINERLRQINAKSESNTKNAIKSLKGETIKRVFKPDEWTTIFLMNSGVGFELKSNGAFKILDATLIDETFPLIKASLRDDWEEYEEIKDIEIKEISGEVSEKNG